ncbi:alpha/beta hydrolase [bacterium]|nr:alpha/beta hydrolase [bacterium]
MIYLISFILSTYVFAQDCSVNDKTGMIRVPLSYSFSVQQTQWWPRTKEITDKIGTTYKDQTSQIFYEFAEPYNPQKETLIIIGGFYPWQNLGFVSKGAMSFLKKDYNVFEIHFRGSGCSSFPAGLQPLTYTHEMIASDIEMIRKELKIPKLNVWASSNGAYVALTYATLFPDSAGKFLLRDTAIYNPGLIEASLHFENNILPEFLGDARNQQLAFIKQKDLSIYKKIMSYFGTLFFRREDSREIGVQIFDALYAGISDGSTESLQATQEMIQQLDTKMETVEPWNEAVYANEFLSTPEYDTDPNFKMEDVFVVKYSPQRCIPYVLTQMNNQISNLDFRGHLGHLKNPFFIYQGYWDDFLYKELAIELNNHLANSRIYIDRNAGHGEISQKTFPCFAAILGGFYKDENSEAYKNVCAPM